jgi:hypothetical protein
MNESREEFEKWVEQKEEAIRQRYKTQIESPYKAGLIIGMFIGSLVTFVVCLSLFLGSGK